MFRYLFPVFCFSIFIAACSSAESKKIEAVKKQQITDSIRLLYDAANANKEIDAFMQNLHKRSGFNGNVLIAKKGEIIYKNSFGWADYLRRDSLKLTSNFELASVSKPLTATGIMLLVDQGKLKLDQTVTDFFPDFPYQDVTIRQLLTHYSGLPNYIYFTDDKWPDKRKGMSNRDVIDLLIKFKPARFNAPGNRFLYNNTNYMMLASIIEKVSGQTFTVFMQQNVFQPAGMKNTAVLSKAEYEKIPTDVVGHDKIWRRSVVQNFHDGPVGDKGIYSTIEDLFLFDRALQDGRILSQSTQDSSYIGYGKPINSVFNYGYGWRLYEKGEHVVAYHTGWWHGFKNLYIRDLKNDITIVLLTNLANNSLQHLDGLYEILNMPIIRQGAYSRTGELLVKKK
jgi:CubicO group peptidase (beta-lactamase class C family)